MFKQKDNPTGKKCWNGVNCKFLARGKCQFSHPQLHQLKQVRQHNQRFSEPMRIANNLPRQTERSNSHSINFLELRPAQWTLRSRFQHFIQTYTRVVRNKNSQENKGDQNFKWFFIRNKAFKINEMQQIDLKNYDQCSICFESFKAQNIMKETLPQDNDENALIIQLFCSHVYHKQCIQNWLKKKPQCPVCRKDFRDHLAYQQWDPAYKQRIKCQQNKSGQGRQAFRALIQLIEHQRILRARREQNLQQQQLQEQAGQQRQNQNQNQVSLQEQTPLSQLMRQRNERRYSEQTRQSQGQAKDQQRHIQFDLEAFGEEDFPSLLKK